MGVGKLLAGFGIALAFLLVFGAVFALTVYEEAKPIIEREYPTFLYAREDECDSPCGSNGATELWNVQQGANEVKFLFNATLDTPSGPAHIVVTDPSGEIVFDMVVTTRAQEAASWPAKEGEWRITRTYAGVLGRLEFLVWSEGIPAGTL